MNLYINKPNVKVKIGSSGILTLICKCNLKLAKIYPNIKNPIEHTCEFFFLGGGVLGKGWRCSRIFKLENIFHIFQEYISISSLNNSQYYQPPIQN